MKIFDCTTYFDEELMMDVRFNILNEYVEKFIVVESKYSHSGRKKNLRLINSANFQNKDFGLGIISYLLISHR